MRGFLRALILGLGWGGGVAASQCDSYPTYASGSQNVTIQVDGANRTFQLFTPWSQFECGEGCFGTGPPHGEGAVSRPVVINWHGCNAHVPVVSYQELITKVEQMAAGEWGETRSEVPSERRSEVPSERRGGRLGTRSLHAFVLTLAPADYGWYVLTPVGSKDLAIQEFGWNTYGIKCGSVLHDDFHFFDAMLEFAEKELCVDR